MRVRVVKYAFFGSGQDWNPEIFHHWKSGEIYPHLPKRLQLASLSALGRLKQIYLVLEHINSETCRSASPSAR